MQLIRTARVASLCLVAIAAALTFTARVDAAPVPAPAATAPAPAPAVPPARFKGIVTAVSGAQIMMTGEDGASSAITVAADAWIVKGRPIKASEIHPGDFVATANVNNPDGTGTSTELRVFPAGLRIGEGSYPMEEPNTTMTNATVAQVTDVGADRQLTVSFGASAAGTPAGTRTIKLPANVQVMQWYRVAITDVHAGNRVRGRGTKKDGVLVADFVFADDPPPPAAPAH